jgi:hypothetical protein
MSPIWQYSYISGVGAGDTIEVIGYAFRLKIGDSRFLTFPLFPPLHFLA